jgi:hypothetical protein
MTAELIVLAASVFVIFAFGVLIGYGLRSSANLPL